VIVNCSAYNAVDAAQADEASAFAVNARGPAILADAATAAGTVLVHFSTDFVFDGEARQPYSEDDPVNPLSVYGASKLAGEVGVRRAPRHYVLRVESLFGGLGVRGHRSTVDHIAETLRAGGMVRALADRTVSPSYVPDVAQATRALLEGNAPSGTYHCVSSGFTTWFDLAREIAQRLAVSESRIEPAMIADFETAAPRPQFCALSNEKLRAAGICMPVWQSAIERHLATNGSQLC
jgi:dTDP-4-dehydrorhamnose reductase